MPTKTVKPKSVKPKSTKTTVKSVKPKTGSPKAEKPIPAKKTTNRVSVPAIKTVKPKLEPQFGPAVPNLLGLVRCGWSYQTSKNSRVFTCLDPSIEAFNFLRASSYMNVRPLFSPRLAGESLEA